MRTSRRDVHVCVCVYAGILYCIFLTCGYYAYTMLLYTPHVMVISCILRRKTALNRRILKISRI